MADMKQLPGLLKQEKDALSCYLSVLFKHHSNTQQQDIKQGLLQDFVQKSLEIFDLFTQKQQRLIDLIKQFKNQNILIQSFPSDNYQLILLKLEYHELERQIINFRSIIQNVLIPKFQSLNLQDIKQFNKLLIKSLIEVSKYSFAKNYASLTCAHCQKCQTCQHQTSDNADDNIRELLIKIIEFCVENK